MNTKIQLLKYSAVFLLIINVGLLTFWRNALGVVGSSLLFLLSGLGIGVIILQYAITYRNTGLKISSEGVTTIGLGIKIGCFLFGVFFCGVVMWEDLLHQPVFYDDVTQSGSDIIPQIGTMITRLLAGEFPYTPIHWKEYTLFPTYLPAQWLPFVPAELIGLDYRWWAFAFFVLAILAACTKFKLFWTGKTGKSVLLILLPFAVFYSFQDNDAYIFKCSIETLICAYYFGFALSLFFASTRWQAVMLSLCLLSRYSIALWLPLYFLVVYKRGGKTPLITQLVIICSVFLIIYVLPFLMQDQTIFAQGFAQHTKGTLGAWQTDMGYPPILYQGYGFGWWFYENISGNLMEKIAAYRTCHAILSMITVGLLSIFYWKKKEQLNHQLFLLGSLIIYLAVFYNFFQIPFTYLYLVPVYVSLLGVMILCQMENIDGAVKRI